MSNLASNEFYRDEKNALNNILEGVEHLRRQCRELVIVTNEVFCDGMDYGAETMRYIRLLGGNQLPLGTDGGYGNGGSIRHSDPY